MGIWRRTGSRKQNRETYPGFTGNRASAGAGSGESWQRCGGYSDHPRRHQFTAWETSVISTVTMPGIPNTQTDWRWKKKGKRDSLSSFRLQRHSYLSALNARFYFPYFYFKSPRKDNEGDKRQQHWNSAQFRAAGRARQVENCFKSFSTQPEHPHEDKPVHASAR